MTRPPVLIHCGDSRAVAIPDCSVDSVITSPPYWRKRNYGNTAQIGQESTPEGYVAALVDCLKIWRNLLRPTGSVFLNVGDTFHRQSLAGIPGRIETAAVADGWLIRNRIVWAKVGGMPDPAANRLASRHEYVIHLAANRSYFYDLFGYSQTMGSGANPGDVWQIPLERTMSGHLAPFPTELARRAVLLVCPKAVCAECGEPRRRIVQRTSRLNPSRPQARRAMELAAGAGLTPAHIAAIQATGISDAGKATRVQTGTGRNSAEVQALATEAKAALGGYFREYTFAQRVTTGWTDCGHAAFEPGVVLDPFMGTGTTLRAARDLDRHVIGIELDNAVCQQAAEQFAQLTLSVETTIRSEGE